MKQLIHTKRVQNQCLHIDAAIIENKTKEEVICLKPMHVQDGTKFRISYPLSDLSTSTQLLKSITPGLIHLNVSTHIYHVTSTIFFIFSLGSDSSDSKVFLNFEQCFVFTTLPWLSLIHIQMCIRDRLSSGRFAKRAFDASW